MKPYKFESFLKTTIWGGEQIAAFKGIDTDLHNVGESWEISDFPGQESVVATGEDKGLNLSALVEKYKEQLVGEKVYAKFGNHFPLLVKQEKTRGSICRPWSRNTRNSSSARRSMQSLAIISHCLSSSSILIRTSRCRCIPTTNWR